MESVYFGKENTVLNKSGVEPAPKGTRPREYYFPDENTKKLDIIAFISALLASALLDLFVFGLVFPVMIMLFADHDPVFKLISVNVFIIADIGLIYIFFTLIIYALIHNIGRKKVFVNDNGTFYFLRMKVRVKTHKKLFSSEDKANQKIHARYGKYISRIDKKIDNKGLSVYKILTGCTESDNIHEDGKYFSGFNEKTVTDEEFKIPSGYFKYDPNETYYKNKAGYIILLWLIKLSLYAGVFLWLYSIGKTRFNAFLANFDSYRDSKIEIFETLGLEYTENESLIDHKYDYLEFIDTSDNYLRNSVRLYFVITDDGQIMDDSLNIHYDMYYNRDDELETVLKILDTATEMDESEMQVVETAIQEYFDEGYSYINTSDENVYYTVSVSESYFADYKVFIYYTNRNTFQHWF